jgi:hypothetical protein
MITNDQRKRYWVELHAVMEKVGSAKVGSVAPRGPSGNVGCNDPLPPSAQDIEVFRHDFHAKHGLPPSTKDFTKQDFDTFLAACRAITQSGDLKPQLRALDQPKARLLHKILVEQAAQLKALGHTDPSISIGQISSQKFHGRKPHDLSAVRPPQDQDSQLKIRYSQLEMLMFTVARMISEQRQARGWTVHELLWESGLGKTCTCADCRRSPRGARKNVGTVAPRGPSGHEPGTFGQTAGFLEDIHADNVPF